MTNRRSITLHNAPHGTQLEVLEHDDCLSMCVSRTDGKEFDPGYHGIAVFLEPGQLKELKDFLRVLPAEPTREIINAMERTFFGEYAIEITGPDDDVGKRQWGDWAEVYAAILEAARG